MELAVTLDAVSQLEPEPRSWLWVASLLSLLYSSTILIIRLIVRRGGYDACDYTLWVAYALAVVSHVCIFISLRLGLGNDDVTDDSTLKHISILLFVTKTLLFPLLGVSKLSILIYARRIYAHSKRCRTVVNCLIVLILVWSLICPILIAADCEPRDFLLSPAIRHCRYSVARHRATAVIEGVTELAIVFVPIMCIVRMEVPLNHKLKVCFGFAVRITVIPLLVMYFLSLMSIDFTSGNDPLMCTNYVWQEALVCWSLILATMPTLRVFTGRFQSGALRDIVAEPKAPVKKPEAAPATNAASSLAQKSIAVFKGFVAFSIFDPKRVEGQPDAQTACEPTYHHWANIFVTPGNEDCKLSGVHAAGSVAAGMDWEKQRASEIMHSGIRASVGSIDFITSVDIPREPDEAVESPLSSITDVEDA